MSWSPSQYVKFEAERNRPILDLLNALPALKPGTAVDLGCGPGNSTELLMRRLPHTDVLGIDSSPDMIEAARMRLPKGRFTVADIADWHTTPPVDLIFANASLQWVPDHARLLPRLLAGLAPGGVLAMQVPDNLDEPAHRLMREVAADGPWAADLAEAGAARAERHDATWYYRVATEGGATRADIWRTTYHHPLQGAGALVEWFKGTGLRPFLAALDEASRAAYLARYEAALAAAYPAMPDGTVLLPFPRLFIVATR